MNEARDFFEVSTTSDKVLIKGGNALSLCPGLKWYLNNYCQSSISWRGDHLAIPDNPLPQVYPAVKISTPYQNRYIFNYCTFGYSMAHWDWDQWERTRWFLLFSYIFSLAVDGKPWIWNIIQNFCDRVDLYGGLTQIHENYLIMVNPDLKGGWFTIELDKKQQLFGFQLRQRAICTSLKYLHLKG